jgi:hypothetical protein
MRAKINLFVEVEYEGSGQDGDVHEYAYELAGFLANFPTPPAGIKVNAVGMDNRGVELE